MSTVAVVTMVRNEGFKLPRWINYYSSQVGSANCYIIDNGSDDGSTLNIGGCQIIKIPSLTFDNQIRADFISNFVNGLLKYYTYVIYTDCDEIIVADPATYEGIGDFCNKERPDYIYSIGVDILHKLDIEPALRSDAKVSLQRSFVHFSSAMCKHNLTGLPVRWAKGFHSSQHPPKFGSLFNFHLRYSDLDEGLDRLAFTREQVKWAFDDEGKHQMLPDSQFAAMMRHWGQLPLQEGDDWSSETGVFRNYLKIFAETAKLNSELGIYDVNTIQFGDEIYKLPSRFIGIF
jgi:hypothetical protein